ncbi:MAG: histidine kinase [Acidobacteriota bacterium]|nr:histidine kinase [Acidobacteriota bacterium]
MPGVSARRGHLKVFIGMAAGVGKTYRMLQEGYAAQQAGRDMVIGYLETHGRADTVRLSRGLPVVPRRQVSHRGIVVEEMDVPGIVARAPELCLIDELAHSNAPGMEHLKRYQDVEDVLAAGIDVFSTLNVQHLESLNDRITELSGIRVRETVPDGVLAKADEVVLIDLSPEALLERLHAGKIYPTERVDMALNNFFRMENLAMLREIALRQVAEEVEVKRLTTETVDGRVESLAAEAPRAISDKVLALVQPRPSAQRLVRRAWRSAQRLGADLELLWVRRPGHRETDSEQRALAALRQLAALLGATLVVRESGDVPSAVAEVAREHGTTYILMGAPDRARGIGRLRTPLPMRLMEELPGVDVRMVADRAQLRAGASEQIRVAEVDAR